MSYDILVNKYKNKQFRNVTILIIKTFVLLRTIDRIKRNRLVHSTLCKQAYKLEL